MKILILEDRKSDALLELEQLKEEGLSFEWRIAATEEEYRSSLDEAWDVVLADYQLPNFTGLQALEILKERQPRVPLVLVTGAIGEEKAAEILKQGAADFILKDRLGRLGAAIRQAIDSRVMQDERQAANEKLREQALLLDLAPDAFLVRAIDGHIIFWNKGAERIYEWTSAEVLSAPSALQPLHEPRHFQQAKKLLIESRACNFELTHRAKSGKTVTVMSRWLLIRNERGQPKSILTVDTDLTEVKQLEAQYLRAQRMEEIGTLVGGIAHDLNNILSPIALSTGLLKRMSLGTNALEIVAIIEKSAQRGAEIIKQLLSFSKAAPGEKVVVQLGHLLASMIKTAQETFPKNIEINAKADANIDPILGDPRQLNQLFLLLLLEARDSLPSGGLLQVSMESLDLDESCTAMHPAARAGRYVLVKVAPSGSDTCHLKRQGALVDAPLPGSRQETIFRLVKNHAGFVSSNADEPGCAIYLPAQRSGAESHEPLMACPCVSSQTVLIVEDEEPIAAITRKILEQQGYATLVASNGAEALHLFTQNLKQNPIVLSDMMMPHMDGMAFVKALQAIEPRVRIVISTGTISLELRDAWEAMGLRLFLRKPYSAQQLLQALHDATKGGMDKPPSSSD